MNDIVLPNSDSKIHPPLAPNSQKIVLVQDKQTKLQDDNLKRNQSLRGIAKTGEGSGKEMLATGAGGHS